MRTFKIDENALGFIFSMSAWGNRKKADKFKIETQAQKRMISVSKRLLESDGYHRIIAHMTNTKKWITNRSVPSFFKEGFYLFRKDLVEDVETYLRQRKEELQVLVEEFLMAYPSHIQRAQELLGDQFKESDYPSSVYLRTAFGISHQWVSFDIPQGLPTDIYKQEKEKAEKMWADAAEQIAMSLRESFKGLVAHAVEKLQADVGGKKKIFRDSTITNIVEFIDTFKTRNLTNDEELEALLIKARKIVEDVDPDDLRSDDRLASTVRRQFKKIEKELDGIIVQKPGRKFDFEE